MHWGNVLAALLLLISFILPYLPPSVFPTLSLLSLAVSPLIVVNICFMVYWLVRMRKQFLLSLVVLVLTYFSFNSFFKISSEGEANHFNNSLSVLSYNVRLFNAYEEHPSEENVKQQLETLLTEKTPDILVLQEYYKGTEATFEEYPYRSIHFKNEHIKLGHAIFSKYPIVNKGEFDFEDSNNNSIYADVLVKDDTLRDYNLHLQSMGILPNIDYLQERGSDKIKRRMSQRFVKQEEQVMAILGHKERSPYPVILTGDLNNTPFSYVYHKLQTDMKDAFLERGNGLGTTYKFQQYPMRIDYVLVPEQWEVIHFETISETFSDHYPVFATLAW